MLSVGLNIAHAAIPSRLTTKNKPMAIILIILFKATMLAPIAGVVEPLLTKCTQRGKTIDLIQRKIASKREQVYFPTIHNTIYLNFGYTSDAN